MNLSRQQMTLIGIFALFTGPIILVMLMRSSWWQYQPAGSKNHGYLVTPPVHISLLQNDEIDGKWMIFHVLDQECDEQCIDFVTSLRQIHRAAGRNKQYLAVVLLSRTSLAPQTRLVLESIYKEFQFVNDPSGAMIKTLKKVNADISTSSGKSNDIHTYILDPMLNIILAYDQNSDSNDIYIDIKRLLKWSDQEKTK